MHFPNFHINNQWILSQRGEKNAINSIVPYAYLVEKERTTDGKIEDVATIFLSNKECPFKCLMCDLWKNTMDETVTQGSIAVQIEYALERLPTVKHIKLYNSGNFFDQKAIPMQDYDRIVDILHGFDSVLIENHPTFINHRTVGFRDKLKANLQIAIGLETVHQEVLQHLNKQMTLQDFSNSITLLNDHDILSRAFILLRPPFLSEEEGVYWAKKSINFAFDQGVECCVVIPTRTGNGALNALEADGFFQKPRLRSLEAVHGYGILLNKGRAFADVWDLDQFSDCNKCLEFRKDRIHQMNLEQRVMKRIECGCNLSHPT